MEEYYGINEANQTILCHYYEHIYKFVNGSTHTTDPLYNRLENEKFFYTQTSEHPLEFKEPRYPNELCIVEFRLTIKTTKFEPDDFFHASFRIEQFLKNIIDSIPNPQGDLEVFIDLPTNQAYLANDFYSLGPHEIYSYSTDIENNIRVNLVLREKC